MAPLAPYAAYKHFLITSPAPYVAHVEINRPGKLNSFIESMWLELRSIFRQLSTDADIRSVILSGAGDRAFTTGLDVQAASSTLMPGADKDAARRAAVLREHISEFQGCISAIEKCQKPVICVAHGFCYGLGIDIVSATDIRICTQNTRFAVKEVDIGLAADIGTLSRLPKIVGNASWVKDVSLTARDFSADEALTQGFVSKVCDSKTSAVEAAQKLAATIAEKSPVAVQGTKELINYSRDHTVDEGLRYTQLWNSAALQTSDVQSAVSATLRRSKPTFEKL